MTGDIKITSAGENSMSGEINLSDGEKKLKEFFRRKVLKENNYFSKIR